VTSPQRCDSDESELRHGQSAACHRGTSGARLRHVESCHQKGAPARPTCTVGPGPIPTRLYESPKPRIISCSSTWHVGYDADMEFVFVLYMRKQFPLSSPEEMAQYPYADKKHRQTYREMTPKDRRARASLAFKPRVTAARGRFGSTLNMSAKGTAWRGPQAPARCLRLLRHREGRSLTDHRHRARPG
jgi:hypothetical protein